MNVDDDPSAGYLSVHCLLSIFVCVCILLYLSQKTRFNEDNEKGSNARRERSLEIWSNGHDFLGFMPQSSVSSLVGETGDLYDKLGRHDSASAYACATPNDEVDSHLLIHFMMDVATYV